MVDLFDKRIEEEEKVKKYRVTDIQYLFCASRYLIIESEKYKDKELFEKLKDKIKELEKGGIIQESYISDKREKIIIRDNDGVVFGIEINGNKVLLVEYFLPPTEEFILKLREKLSEIL